MRFIAKTREALCRLEVQSPEESEYELFGAFAACGGAPNGRHASVARRMLITARRCAERIGESSIEKTEDGRFGGHALYTLRTGREPELPLPETPEQAQAYLRGAFLLRGAVAEPEKPCSLEIRFPSAEAADKAAGVMRLFELEPRVQQIRGKHSVYLRSRESVGSFLGYIGATEAYLAMESRNTLKDMRASVQRQVNFDNANITRTRRGAEKQTEAIMRIEHVLGLEKLSPALEEIARLRLEYEQLTLEELGAKCDPPVSKGVAGTRMNRVLGIAKKLAEKK